MTERNIATLACALNMSSSTRVALCISRTRVWCRDAIAAPYLKCRYRQLFSNQIRTTPAHTGNIGDSRRSAAHRAINNRASPRRRQFARICCARQEALAP